MPFTKPKAAQIDFDVTNITDPLIRLNSGASGSNSKDVGIVVERGSDTNAAIIWDESENQFAVINTSEDGSTGGNVSISSYADLTLKKITQSEQEYTTSNMMKFNQRYTGAASGSYYSQNEYQKVVTITPSGNSQNYQVSGRMMAQSGGSIQIITFNAALRSNTLPDLSFSQTFSDQHNGTAFIKPQLWHKQTTTAGFVIAFQYIHSSSLFGSVTVDIDVIPRDSSQKANVSINSTVNSEQSTVDTGFTAVDMTKIIEINDTNVNIADHDGSADGLELAGTLVTATAAELNYSDGVTSNIQTQLDAKQATITGAATTIDDTNLTASRALVSNSSGKVAVSAVTSTELGYVDGVTSAIQTQLDSKQATITGAATTIDDTNLTASRALISNASGKVAVSAVTSTELGYLDGVSSAIQTQIDNISTSFTLAADSGTNDAFTTGSTLTFAGGTGIDTTVSNDQISTAIDSTVVTKTGTQTLTNKTLTSPKINEDVAVTSTATEINKLDGATVTTTEINIIDGNTSIGTTAVAGGDGIVTNDAGTMRQTTVDTFDTYLAATTKTLTNKTISGSSNTLSNIGNSSLTNSSITVARQGGNSTAISLGGTITFNNVANETTVAESSGTVTIGLADAVTIPNLTVSQDATVTGNLTVNGTTTTISTTNSVIEDGLIELNTGASSNSNDLGFIFERGSTGNNAAFIWDESADKFTLGTTTATGASTGNLSITKGTLVADITGDVTGNADTATALATARAIAGQDFDGTAAITIASTDLSNASSIVLVSGNTMTGNLDFNDNVAARFGTGNDLSISHNATNSIITNGVGDLQITNTANDKDIIIQSDDGSGGTADYIRADGSTTSVKLYYGGTSVFETTSTGAKITNTSTSDALLITTTEDSATAGPVIALKRNSGSPADADYIGQIKFLGENDADQEVVYAKITGKIGDASDTTEDGILEIAHRKAGSNNIGVRITSTEFKIMNGMDFDVETHDASSNGLRLNGTLITATAAEINKLDGVTATTAELNYTDGVTSNIQTQLDAKQATITGAATTIDDTNLTASRALVSNSSGKVAVSAVTSTELGYLDGVTSAIQTQIDSKGTGTLSNIVEDTSPELGGTLTANQDINVSQGKHVNIGGANLETYNTYNTFTLTTDGVTANSIYICPDDTHDVYIRHGTNPLFSAETMAHFNANAEVSLYYNNSKKFETSSTGATITGTLAADGLTMGDDEKIQLGASQDLQIYHDGTHSFIKDNGTGDIVIDGYRTRFTSGGHAGTVFLEHTTDGYGTGNFGWKMYYTGTGTSVEKFKVTSSGVDITGTAEMDTLSIGGTAVTSTPAELNKLDGATVTTAEINIIDGNTSATSTTVADADRVVYNDAGTMKQVAVTDLDTYFSATTKTLTNKTLTSPQITTDIRLNAQAAIEFYDSDSSHYVAFAAPATITSNLTWTLPNSDGTADQVLATNGGGVLSWADPGSGGGSGSSFPNSTIQTCPGADGDFDLSKTNNTGSAETPFEAGGTDAFGVNLGTVFSLMDPIGSVQDSSGTGVDLGVLS